MVHRAQDLAGKFGYKDARKDTAFWFRENLRFLLERASKLPRSEAFGDLKSAQQGHTKFYFRQSPLDMLGWNTDWTVMFDSPPQTVTGMVTVVLEPDGSLDHFLAVPPQVAPITGETRSTPDWNALFAESGLDPKRFEPEAPVWISPVPFDASMGWKGSYAQDPTAAVSRVCRGVSRLARLLPSDRSVGPRSCEGAWNRPAKLLRENRRSSPHIRVVDRGRFHGLAKSKSGTR
jgi:hypothetical protein